MTEPEGFDFKRAIRRWWSAPAFVALLIFEFYSAYAAGQSPNWFWVGLAVAGLIFVALVNFSGMRR